MSGLGLIASGDSLLNYNVAVSIVVQLYSYEVNVKTKLVRSKDVFCVMSQADCKVVITKAAMFVRKVKL